MPANLIFGLSRAADGEMKAPGRVAAGRILKNRKKFFAGLGVELKNVAWAGVTQGTNIAEVQRAQGGKILKRTDGLISCDNGLILAITIADCLPIYFYDSINNAVGLAHAGWRGVEKNFPVKMLGVMAKEFKTGAGQVKVWLGPHLKSCHFEVKDDVAERFKAYPGAVIKRRGRLFVDLSLAVKHQLKAAGVKAKNIKVVGGCTFCQKKYFSFRRDKLKRVKAMAACIGLK